jgi:hypothetical protein
LGEREVIELMAEHTNNWAIEILGMEILTRNGTTFTEDGVEDIPYITLGTHEISIRNAFKIANKLEVDMEEEGKAHKSGNCWGISKSQNYAGERGFGALPMILINRMTRKTIVKHEEMKNIVPEMIDLATNMSANAQGDKGTIGADVAESTINVVSRRFPSHTGTKHYVTFKQCKQGGIIGHGKRYKNKAESGMYITYDEIVKMTDEVMARGKILKTRSDMILTAIAIVDTYAEAACMGDQVCGINKLGMEDANSDKPYAGAESLVRDIETRVKEVRAPIAPEAANARLLPKAEKIFEEVLEKTAKRKEKGMTSETIIKFHREVYKVKVDMKKEKVHKIIARKRDEWEKGLPAEMIKYVVEKILIGDMTGTTINNGSEEERRDAPTGLTEVEKGSDKKPDKDVVTFS